MFVIRTFPIEGVKNTGAIFVNKTYNTNCDRPLS